MIISIINRGFNTARWSDISLSQNLFLLLLLLLFLLLLLLLFLFLSQLRNTLLTFDMYLEKHWRFSDFALLRWWLHTWVLLPRTLPKFSTLGPPVHCNHLRHIGRQVGICKIMAIATFLPNACLDITGVQPCCSRSPNLFRPSSTHSNHMDFSVKMW